MTLDEGEIREPPDNSWVSLTAALTWIEFQHALEVEELLARLQGGGDQAVRLLLQGTWRRLADQASVGRIDIRGRSIGDRLERPLDSPDLRNNRYLAWVQQENASADVRVERHDGTDDIYDGEWERLGDDRGSDYHHVVMRRDQLLWLYPAPSLSIRGRRRSFAQAERRADWLRAQLKTTPVKSLTKRHFIAKLKADYGVSGSQANQIWREVTPEYPAWSAPGRPRKIDSSEIDSK